MNTACYIYDQLEWLANKKKRGLDGENAIAYLELPRKEKIAYLNSVVFPAYKKAGSPKPYTQEMVRFIQNTLGAYHENNIRSN